MKIVLWAEASQRYSSILTARTLPEGARVIPVTSEEEAMAHVDSAEVLICWGAAYPGPFIRAARSLRLIQSMGVGVEGLLEAGAAASPVPLANARGGNSAPIAEHVMALILAFARCLHISIRNQAAHTWDPRVSRGVEIAGQTLGILGLGSIGLDTARRARAMGMRVISVERAGRERPPEVDQLVADKLALAAQSDYLLVATPLTPETQRLVDEAVLDAMKPGAYLINISRGPVMDTAAVVAALRAGRLGGAAMDVHDKQPLTGQEPVFDAPNLLLTPHVAGITATSMRAMSEGAVATVLALLRGERPANVVNPEVFR